MKLRPLIAFRDYHSTTHENGAINPAVEERSGLASVTPYQGLPSLYLAHNAAELRKTGDWYRNFEYDVERERGLDFSEDLFNPLVLRFDLTPSPSSLGHCLHGASTMSPKRPNIGRQKSRVAECRRIASPIDDDFVQDLAAAADQYIVSRGDQKTVIAGYHWFSDWGRDTMIALPGLTLADWQA